jgi:hypothetical protein
MKKILTTQCGRDILDGLGKREGQALNSPASVLVLVIAVLQRNSGKQRGEQPVLGCSVCHRTAGAQDFCGRRDVDG